MLRFFYIHNHIFCKWRCICISFSSSFGFYVFYFPVVKTGSSYGKPKRNVKNGDLYLSPSLPAIGYDGRWRVCWCSLSIWGSSSPFLLSWELISWFGLFCSFLFPPRNYHMVFVLHFTKQKGRDFKNCPKEWTNGENNSREGSLEREPIG